MDCLTKSVENAGKRKAFHKYMEVQGKDVLKAIRDTKELTEDTENKLKEAISNFYKPFNKNVCPKILEVSWDAAKHLGMKNPSDSNAETPGLQKPEIKLNDKVYLKTGANLLQQYETKEEIKTIKYWRNCADGLQR